MGLPRQVKKQLKEAEDILAQLNAKPGDAPPGTPPNPDVPPPAPDVQPPPISDNKKPDQPDVPAGGSNPPPSPPPGEDFEAKYRSLKGKYDAEVGAVARDNAGLRERIGVLEQLLANLTDRQNTPPTTPPSPDDKRPGKKYIQPADIEEYGNDMADFVQRAAREAVEPELEALRAENQRLKQQVGQNTEQVATSARDRLFARMDRDVPGWQDTNKDQKFLAWLQELDVFSGLQRSKALENAYNSNDADRVVGIFKAFLREDSATNQPPPPAPRQPAVALETLVAPGAPRGPAPAAPGDNKGRIISQAEISDFYDKKRRGKIAPADAVAFEREIALAVKENRVTL